MIAQSSFEAEYVAFAEAVRKAVWFKKLEKPLGAHTSIYDISFGEDGQGCLCLTDNKNFNPRSKHFDIRHQMVVDNIRKYVIETFYARSPKMAADITTKALRKKFFQKLREKLGMIPKKTTVRIRCVTLILVLKLQTLEVLSLEGDCYVYTVHIWTLNI